ncbi:uncharacterized protein FIBRA_07346 [Fibroporia radiculosa]|uniref:CHAT domain-containing protein n=1 Tax=Fibroporia radiculosa TaxID=599839 RepID=J4GE61_9APHY|nr:uncharacterized protein FIBRA_07346 [Fibroporia radiculosa]CCM05138.1 predicted protein [Fibroporia radiculosa]
MWLDFTSLFVYRLFIRAFRSLTTAYNTRNQADLVVGDDEFGRAVADLAQFKSKQKEELGDYVYHLLDVDLSSLRENPRNLAYVAEVYYNLSFREGCEHYVDLAIKFYQRATASVPDEDIAKPEDLGYFGMALEFRGRIDQAIDVYERFLMMAADSSPLMVGCLYNLGNLLWDKLQANVGSTSRLQDIERVLFLRKRLVEITANSENDANRATYCFNLSRAQIALFIFLNPDPTISTEGLGEAHEFLKKLKSRPKTELNGLLVCVSFFPLHNVDSSKRVRSQLISGDINTLTMDYTNPDVLAFFADLYRLASESDATTTEGAVRLGKAVTLYECLIGSLPDNHAQHVSAWPRLAYAFELLGLVDKAIYAYDRFLTLSQGNSSMVIYALVRLTDLLWARYMGADASENTVTSDIARVVSLRRRLVEIADDDEYMSGYRDSLARAYIVQYSHLHDRFELSNEGMEVAVKHFDEINRDDPQVQALCSFFLAGQILQRYNEEPHTMPIEHIERMVSLLQRAVDLNGDDDLFTKAMLCDGLAYATIMRIEKLENGSDIVRAISLAECAVGIKPDHAPYRFTLSTALRHSYMASGTLGDADRAIAEACRAISCVDLGQSADYTSVLAKGMYELARTYIQRYFTFGDISDVYSALEYHEKASSLTPPGRIYQACYVAALNTAFIISRKPSYSDRSIAECEKLCVLDGPGTEQNRMQLGYSLITRYLVDHEVDKLERAIEAFEHVLGMMPKTWPYRYRCLHDLAFSLDVRTKGRHGGPTVADFDRVVSVIRECVDTVPTEMPSERAMCLKKLGEILLARVDIPNWTGDAIDAFRKAAQLQGADPRIRLASAAEWGRLSFSNGDEADCLQAFALTMDLIPFVAWTGRTTAQQHSQISALNIGELGQIAAYVATSFGNHHTALEWLEQSRSVVWGQMLRLRTPKEELQDVDPVLYKKMVTISSGLESTWAGFDQIYVDDHRNVLEMDRQRQHRLAEEWDTLLEQARELPGMESFLKARSFFELASAPSMLGGPVVVFNVHESGCDAFILQTTDDEIVTLKHVPLQFTKNLGLKLQHNLRDMLKGSSIRTRTSDEEYTRGTMPDIPPDRFTRILAILWEMVVRPVISALELQPISDGNNNVLPRIWWCPTGPLSFLPPHAAGLYDTAECGRKVFEYIASSYTHNLSILLEKREELSEDFNGMLLVSQPVPNSPREAAIPKTVIEIEAVARIARESAIHMPTTRLNERDANKETVLEGMRRHNWVHLACHATQHPKHPTESAFSLTDGPLTLREIARRAHPRGELAFLSACHTATGDEALTEEAVHLAAGMLMAGYRSVVATMWSIRDSDAPIVAESFYGQLFGGGKAQRAESGLALHHATRVLRETVSENNFLSWVPFIHVGL